MQLFAVSDKKQAIDSGVKSPSRATIAPHFSF